MSENKKATIHFAGNDYFVGATPSGHAQAIETDSGRAGAATPMELLLLALGSCTGVDVISILKKKRQHVSDYRIEVSGERREEFPRSYTRLFVKHIVTGRAVSEPALAQAIAHFHPGLAQKHPARIGRSVSPAWYAPINVPGNW